MTNNETTDFSAAEYLQQRRPAIAASWYQAIAYTSFVPHSPLQVRQKLSELTEQAIAVVTGEPFDHEKARNIGTTLAQLGYQQPEALAGTQEALTREFFQDLPAGLAGTIQPRFAMLLGRMSSGFFQAALAQVLTQQEQIRNALISARQRAEKVLRENETRYRAISELASDFAYALRVEPDGTVRREWITEAFTRITGYTPEEFDASGGWQSIVHPDDADTLLQRVQSLLAGQTSTGEYRIITKNGQVRWLHDHMRIEREARWEQPADQPPSATASGRVVRILGAASDITERKLAEQAEREQRQFAEALRDTAAVLNSTLELDQVLDHILSNLERVVRHDAANIMLMDTPDVVRIARVKGFTPSGTPEADLSRRYVLAETPGLYQMAQSGQPLVVPDTTVYADRDSWAETSWVRSYAGAPIRTKGQLVGFLNVNSSTPGFYQSAQAERLQAFADQAALAIENARLYEATRRNVERLTRLYEAGNALALAATIDDLYREIVRWAVRLVNAHSCNLGLFDGAEHLVAVAVENLPDYIVSSRVKLGEGLNGRAALLRQPQYTKNYATLDHKQQAAIASEMSLTAVVVMPLVWQDRLIGTLGIIDNRERDYADDIPILTSFATLVAATLEQRRAMTNMQAREAEARMLTAHLARVQEEERARLAAQLHDSIGYHLITLQKNAEGIQSEIPLDDPLHPRLTVSMALLQETQQMVNSLAIDLDIKQLEARGLDPAARQYVERLCTAGCPINLHVTGHVQRLPAEAERIAFRTLQEALTNAMRHSQATRISAHLHFGRKSLRLNVQDNGRGFDPAALENSPATGLAGLRLQAQTLEGMLTVQSDEGKGTLVTLHLPFKPISPVQSQTSVLLVEPHDVICQGLRLTLAESGEFTCVGEASDGTQALHHVELSQPGLVLIDVRLPGHSGIEITRQITRRFPQVRVVILSYAADETYLEQALLAGAKGFLLVSDDSHQIVEGLRSVMQGKFTVSAALAAAWDKLELRSVAEDTHELITSREREVLTMIAAGYSNRMIADEMGISRRTVEVHRRNIKAKMKTRNSAQMIQAAIQLGLISLRP